MGAICPCLKRKKIIPVLPLKNTQSQQANDMTFNAEKQDTLISNLQLTKNNETDRSINNLINQNKLNSTLVNTLNEAETQERIERNESQEDLFDRSYLKIDINRKQGNLSNSNDLFSYNKKIEKQETLLKEKGLKKVQTHDEDIDDDAQFLRISSKNSITKSP